MKQTRLFTRNGNEMRKKYDFKEFIFPLTTNRHCSDSAVRWEEVSGRLPCLCNEEP